MIYASYTQTHAYTQRLLVYIDLNLLTYNQNVKMYNSTLDHSEKDPKNYLIIMGTFNAKITLFVRTTIYSQTSKKELQK